MLKSFIKECLFFQTDNSYYKLLGICGWLCIINVVVNIYKIIKP